MLMSWRELSYSLFIYLAWNDAHRYVGTRLVEKGKQPPHAYTKNPVDDPTEIIVQINNIINNTPELQSKLPKYVVVEDLDRMLREDVNWFKV